MDAEVAAEGQCEDETFFGSDIDADSEAESQQSSPTALRLKMVDDSSESEDEESSPEINSESGASDGSDVVSSAAEEEMEDRHCGTTTRRIQLQISRSCLRTLQLFFVFLAAYCTLSKVVKLPTHLRMLNIYCKHTSYTYIAPIWSTPCILVYTLVLNRNIELFLG